MGHLKDTVDIILVSLCFSTKNAELPFLVVVPLDARPEREWLAACAVQLDAAALSRNGLKPTGLAAAAAAAADPPPLVVRIVGDALVEPQHWLESDADLMSAE